MDERKLTHNTAIQTSLELLGEGELPQARDVLIREVVSNRMAGAAWGLLSVLATDQAEAERCLDDVSRLLFVDQRGIAGKDAGLMAAELEAGLRVEPSKEKSVSLIGAPEPLAAAKRHIPEGSTVKGQPRGHALDVVWPSADGSPARHQPLVEGVPKNPSRHSTSAASLRCLIRLSGAIFSGMLVLVMVGVIALLLAPRIVGAHLLVVQSQSMEPLVPMGALVVSLPVSPSEVVVGDVVTFESRDLGGTSGVVTHRVIEKSGIGIELRFVTKGDASEAADLDPVPPSAIIGRAALIIPLIGFLIVGIRTPLGFLALIGIPALILLAGELREIVSLLRTRAREATDVA